ncbi:YdgA family protein [Pasteurella oralis]|uniref:YdgA family protein n=1 Tax=Pasteurella oralis TaxID=1071947 RepID=UPI000C79E103|nr:DUF945 family protein [Pasteurella oralis]
MKKSLVALGVIVALGAVWTGSAWYTGKAVEEKAQERLDLINAGFAGLASAGSEVKFTNLAIERGIFSSNVTYDFVATFPDTQVTIPFEGTLYHGPFPLDRVSKFDLLPTLLSSNDRIVQNEETQAWFDYAQGKNPFESHIKIGYDSTFSGQARIAPIKLDLSDADIVWKGIELNFDKVTANGIGKSQAIIDGLKLAIDDTEDASKAIIEVNKIKIDSDLQRTEWEQIPVGKQSALIDSFRVSLTERDMRDFNLEYRNMSFDASTKKENTFVNYELVAKAPEMLVNGKTVGDLDAKVKLEHLDGKATNELLMLVDNNADYEPLPEEQIQALAKTILQNQPLLQLDPLKLTTDEGDLKADLVIEMASGNFDMLEQGKILDLFKQLAVNVDLNKNALTKLFAMVEEANGVTKEDAIVAAEQAVNAMFEEAIQQGVLVDSESSVKLGLLLENKALKLNGQPIPEEQILMTVVLFFLGMSY